MESLKGKKKKKLPQAVWALGFVSLFMDTSSEMIHGLLPVFLVSVLGASLTMVGLIEGLGEATALIFKVFSGPLSDWWGKRKPLIFSGYLMAALSKPLFALAPTAFVVLGARLFDRAGKGVRGAPRDALIADVTPQEMRGRAFGLRQSLDTVGAFLGPLIGIILMFWTWQNYRLIFWIATIPAFVALGVLLWGVKEPRNKQVRNSPLSWRLIKEFKFSFWMVVLIACIFQLARFSEAFLILRARDFGLSANFAPAILIAMNVTYAASSYPVGGLSDRIQREWLLVIGFILLTLADVVFGFAHSLFWVFMGVILWGLHMGFTQGVLSALVADHCPTGHRGTGYGLFHLFSAGALLLASVIAGGLWDQFGAEATFFTSALLSLIGALLLIPTFLHRKEG